MESKSKLNKVKKLHVNLRAQAGNKEVESYKFAFSAFLQKRTTRVKHNPNK